ncbi:Thiamine-monophosphate kinase [Thalassocella blandensis]|nr:Thiamine-monophosphate kinase [Thalassocella blandensis]
MNEFELIKRYFTRDVESDDDSESTDHNDTVAIGVGDDCAVLNVPVDHQLVVSIDTLIAGVHFPKQSEAYAVAQRAFSVCVSDLAAMGAEPLWFTLALTLPNTNETWLEKFSMGLFDIADEYNCILVGGNTTRGPLSISIQVHGAVPSGQAITRSGAKVGDLVYVSGPLGDGAAALAMLDKRVKFNDEANEYFYSRFFWPEAKIDLGLKLREIATSAIDISDGFLADLNHICTASKVAAEICVEKLPHSQHRIDQAMFVKDDSLGIKWQQWILSGGDDYQLCFTAPAEANVEALDQHIRCIGKIVEGQGVLCTLDGKEVALSRLGYQHF